MMKLDFGFEVDMEANTVTPNYTMEGVGTTQMKTLPAKDFCEKFIESNPPIGLLPPAVRWVSKDRRVVVFERPPAKYFVEVAWDRKENAARARKSSFDLPMPWQVLVTYFDPDYNPVKIFAYIRPTPMSSLNDPVFLMPMYNVYLNSAICMPVVSTFEDHEASISYGVQEAFNTVWNSGFNLDLQDTMNLYMKNQSPVAVRGRPSAVFAGDATGRFLSEWAKLSLREVTEMKMLSPSSHAVGGYNSIGHFSIAGAIDNIRIGDDGELMGNTSTAIAQIINKFS